MAGFGLRDRIIDLGKGEDREGRRAVHGPIVCQPRRRTVGPGCSAEGALIPRGRLRTCPDSRCLLG